MANSKRSARQRRDQAIRHGVLGVLAEEPGHGYDVGKRLKAVWGPAADLSDSSVYSALEYHEKYGNAVALTGEPGNHSESKRGPTFRITPKGVAKWEDWLRTPSEMEVMRGEVALKVALSRPEDATPLQLIVDDYERTVLARIAQTSAGLDELMESLPDDEAGTRVLAYTRAIRSLDAELEWLREDVRPAVEASRDRALRFPRNRRGGRGAA